MIVTTIDALQRHDPFRASRAQETDHGTKEKKGGITIKRAVGNSSQQSDQRSKSGATAGSGLQKKPNLKRDWSTTTYSVIWATMLKQEQRRETTGWKANSLTTAVPSKVK